MMTMSLGDLFVRFTRTNWSLSVNTKVLMPHFYNWTLPSETESQYTKLFDKRDNFPFFIIRMPDLGGNIPSHVFYGSVMSEFLRIARSTLLYSDFLPVASSLYKRMLNQGGSQVKLLNQIKKRWHVIQQRLTSKISQPNHRWHHIWLSGGWLISSRLCLL